ncbi:unknown [Clostridium sp. CAG:349]|nr:unknown [Clostridium sp. CAG:349]
MKKKILAILLVVSMVAALAVGLTACNKDKKTAPAKADNAETLGTAIAVAMNSSAAGTASAEAADENVEPSFTINGIGAIPGISAATDGLAKYLNEYVNNAKAYIKDHSVEVEITSSDKDGYNYKMLVTVTYKDAEGKDVSDVSTIYINAKKIKDGAVSEEDADINGKEDYTFEAVVAHGEVNLVKIKGTCVYDKEKDTMVFNFGADVGVEVDNAGAKVTAYANEKGGVVVEVNVGVDNACKVNVKVELGKISDTETGAKVYVDVAVGATDKELVKVNVVANVISNANATNLDKTDFAINGTAVVIVAGSANVNVDISGVAKYVPGEPEVENGKYVVQVSGNASVNVGA